MSDANDHGAPDTVMADLHRSSNRHLRTAAIVAGGLVTLASLAVLGVWLAVLHPTDRVTLTVLNRTVVTVDSVEVTDGNHAAILTVGPIPPGGHASDSVHFGDDEGGESNLVGRQGGRTSSGWGWMLMNTHGPYDYTATVSDTGVHLDYDVGSKGSGSYDFASPTTMPTTIP